MKEKKQLTVKQKKNRARALQYITFGGEYVSVITPYAIMAGINADEWFIYNPEPWKIGLGGSIGIALMALSVFLVTKKKENEKLTDGMIALVIGWYAVAFVFFLLAKINMEIYTIMFYGGFGLLGALGLNIASKHFKKVADRHVENIKEAENKLEQEQVTEEIKKVKVKIK